MKTCCYCKDEYPATSEYFYRRRFRSGNYGLQSGCKVCVINKRKQWSKDNRERQNEIVRNAYPKYYANNKIKIILRSSNYKKRHSEKHNEASKASAKRASSEFLDRYVKRKLKLMGIKDEDITPEIIKTKKQIIKIKRLIKQLNENSK